MWRLGKHVSIQFTTWFISNVSPHEDFPHDGVWWTQSLQHFLLEGTWKLYLENGKVTIFLYEIVWCLQVYNLGVSIWCAPVCVVSIISWSPCQCLSAAAKAPIQAISFGNPQALFRTRYLVLLWHVLGNVEMLTLPDQPTDKNPHLNTYSLRVFHRGKPCTLRAIGGGGAEKSKHSSLT